MHKCDVCFKPVNPVDVQSQAHQGNVVCRDFFCSETVAAKSRLPDMLFQQHLARRQQQKREQLEKAKSAELLRAKLAAEITDENDRAVASAKAMLGGSVNVYPLSIPSGLTRLVPLTHQRRDNYRAHLQVIIEQAKENENLSSNFYDAYRNDYHNRRDSEAVMDENEALQQLSDNLCGVCKGGCCAHGSNKAYLNPMTMRRQLDIEPELNAEQLLQRYMDKLGHESVEGSCINHVDGGCSLPREWRADICNGYFCSPLKQYQREVIDTDIAALPPLLALRRAHHNWNQQDPEADHQLLEVVLLEETGKQKLEVVLATTIETISHDNRISEVEW